MQRGSFCTLDSAGQERSKTSSVPINCHVFPRQKTRSAGTAPRQNYVAIELPDDSKIQPHSSQRKQVVMLVLSRTACLGSGWRSQPKRCEPIIDLPNRLRAFAPF
jgi:hypothetical protein